MAPGTLCPVGGPSHRAAPAGPGLVGPAAPVRRPQARRHARPDIVRLFRTRRLRRVKRRRQRCKRRQRRCKRRQRRCQRSLVMHFQPLITTESRNRLRRRLYSPSHSESCIVWHAQSCTDAAYRTYRVLHSPRAASGCSRLRPDRHMFLWAKPPQVCCACWPNYQLNYCAAWLLTRYNTERTAVWYSRRMAGGD